MEVYYLMFGIIAALLGFSAIVIFGRFFVKALNLPVEDDLIFELPPPEFVEKQSKEDAKKAYDARKPLYEQREKIETLYTKISEIILFSEELLSFSKDSFPKQNYCIKTFGKAAEGLKGVKEKITKNINDFEIINEILENKKIAKNIKSTEEAYALLPKASNKKLLILLLFLIIILALHFYMQSQIPK